jgi:hypothetical protein
MMVVFNYWFFKVWEILISFNYLLCFHVRVHLIIPRLSLAFANCLEILNHLLIGVNLRLLPFKVHFSPIFLGFFLMDLELAGLRFRHFVLWLWRTSRWMISRRSLWRFLILWLLILLFELNARVKDIVIVMVYHNILLVTTRSIPLTSWGSMLVGTVIDSASWVAGNRVITVNPVHRIDLSLKPAINRRHLLYLLLFQFSLGNI